MFLITQDPKLPMNVQTKWYLYEWLFKLMCSVLLTKMKCQA